jgi:hypothetical protein
LGKNIIITAEKNEGGTRQFGQNSTDLSINPKNIFLLGELNRWTEGKIMVKDTVRICKRVWANCT